MTESHKWKCKCLPCRAMKAEYHRNLYRGIRRLVPAKRARQLLLTFEDAKDASRMLGIPHMTAWKIRTGTVKKIRQTTEDKILRAA